MGSSIQQELIIPAGEIQRDGASGFAEACDVALILESYEREGCCWCSIKI